MVPVVGLEPTLCCQKRILNPSRLPIPSHRQANRFRKNPGNRRSFWRPLTNFRDFKGFKNPYKTGIFSTGNENCTSGF